ncbi:MAG: response regulator transcription factor [Phycisphaerales bacterium]|nr:response regulator transcription factor [Phycisphaerales bacterium]
MRILVIEDDPAIRRGLVDTLRHESFEVFEAGTAPAGLDLALSLDCHIVLLDLLLPGGDGLSILHRARAARPHLPFIILTARGGEADRVRGLDLGADDYVVKPFSPRELLARIHAVLRRSPARTPDALSIEFPSAALVADLARRELRFADGARADLSERETDLLRYLAAHLGRAVSRDELLANVWQVEPRGLETRTIDMHIARLRDKLRDSGPEPRLLLTVRGKGYMLAADAAPSGIAP